jgi:hypothetical protein
VSFRLCLRFPSRAGGYYRYTCTLYPLQQIKDEGLGEKLCEAIDGLKLGNVPVFWRYKRAPVWQERVKEFLKS